MLVHWLTLNMFIINSKFMRKTKKANNSNTETNRRRERANKKIRQKSPEGVSDAFKQHANRTSCNAEH